jgi:hypothetical protein
LPKSPTGLAPSGSVRRRAGTLLGTVAGAALLAVAATACSSSSSASGGPGKLSQPDTIASLKKSPDQSMAKEIVKAASGQKGADKLTAVVYQDSSDSGKTVMIYGGVGIPLPSGDADAQFKDMLGSGTETGGSAKLGTVATVDAGSAGGKAECAPIQGLSGGAKFVNCAWINDKTALVMTFQSYAAADAQALVPQILTAMTKG